MTDANDNRVDFGTDVNAALRHWGHYTDFPDGFDQVRRVLDAVAPTLGEVAGCYVLAGGRYVAIRHTAFPDNSMYVNWGFIDLSARSMAFAAERGADLRAAISAAGLAVEDGADGIVIWNARGIRRGPNAASGPELRTCPECFLQWPGNRCPDDDVELNP